MNIKVLSIEGAFILVTRLLSDNRGFFREWFKTERFESNFSSFNVAQANLSKSKLGVLRGIHYSLNPEGQSKVVTCADGKIIDVLVDLRRGSPSFLKIELIELSENQAESIFIPSGVGHGFLTLSESASIVYLTSSVYSPQFEKAIHPFDRDLGINWPTNKVDSIILSESDKAAPSFAEAMKMGLLPNFKI